MTKRFWRKLALLMVVPGLMLVASCAKKAVLSSEEIEARQRATEEARRAEEERFRNKLLQDQSVGEERMREEARMRREREMFVNEDIHFEFDKSRILPEAQAILKGKATFLSANPGITVVIEGHCDERGSSEYNMALGDRRAQSTKAFMVDLGIASNRMVTISYGEERPVDPRSNEAAWAKNRRAHFALD
jgi:peptidoglycan-associated lipoprotein